jgi:hypothetical protein
MLRFFARRSGVGAAILVDPRGRASIPAQRLKASSVTLAAVLALTIATPTDNLGSSFAPVRDAAAAALAGAADAIRKRSPGVRRIVGWVKGRPIYARAAPRVRRPPVARAAVRPPVLPALLTPPPPAAPLAFAQNDLPFGPVAIGPLPAYDLSDTEEFAFLRLPEERGPGFLIGGIGGPGPGPGPGGLLPPPPGPPAAIPEASTWAMMIFGFGAIGTAWRRRRQIVRVIVSSGLLRLNPPAG